MEAGSEKPRTKPRKGLFAFRASTLLLAAMLINQGIHHGHAWGATPEGTLSAVLYLLQLALTSFASAQAAHQFFEQRPPGWGAWLAMVATCYGGALVIFAIFGWVVFTSAHHQLPDSAIAFLSANICGILASLTTRMAARRGE